MIEYTIELKTDAEIGSGLGGELVNDYVTRDSDGRPVIRASHIKGVLRQTLMEIIGPLPMMDEQLLREALGAFHARRAATPRPPRRLPPRPQGRP